MGNWGTLNLNDLVPSEVTGLVGQTTGLIQQFLLAYDATIAAAKVYEASLSGGGVDILAVLVKAVRDIVEGLLQAFKVHALFVPIPKRTGAASPIASSIPDTLQDVAYSLGFDAEQVGLALSTGANNSYKALQQQAIGGNGAFFNTFVKSLYDELDPNRPLYNSPGDAVACVVLLAGAASMSQLLKTANSFNRLFRPETSFTARTIPVPQNIRTTVITAPAATTMGVKVEWDAPRASYDSPYFPTVSMAVKKYAVIRSTSATAPNARNVLDLFSTRALVEGLESTDKAKSSKVVAVGSGSNSTFVDTEKLDVTKRYYYCVAWQVVVEENGQETVLPWDLVSAVRKVDVRRIPLGSHGTPPDWSARGSIIDLMPDLAAEIRTVLAQVTAIGDRSTGGPGGAVSDGLTALQKNIDAFSERLDALGLQAEQLAATFGETLPGFYVTSFAGIGGNVFLVSELGKRLNDSSDPTRPPFDSNEYVMGVVIVVGGPRMPDIQPAIDLLNALFNSPKAGDPLYGVLTSIDGLIDQQESRVFGQDMQPVLDPDGKPVDTSVPSSFPVDANTGLPLPGVAGVDPLTGLPPAPPPSPAISNSGLGVGTMDPTNPDAGFTNKATPPTNPTSAGSTTADSGTIVADPSPEDSKPEYKPL